VLLAHEALMSKLSLGANVYRGNSLVAFYVKLGLIGFAMKVFGGSGGGRRLLKHADGLIRVRRDGDAGTDKYIMTVLG
jgi:hypothetical protein